MTVGPLAGQPVIAIAMPVRRDGKAVGVLTANILPRSLGEVLRGQKLRPGWIATLVDSRHLVVARTAQEDAFVARPAIGWMVDFQTSGAAAASNSASEMKPMRQATSSGAATFCPVRFSIARTNSPASSRLSCVPVSSHA